MEGDNRSVSKAEEKGGAEETQGKGEEREEVEEREPNGGDQERP